MKVKLRFLVFLLIGAWAITPPNTGHASEAKRNIDFSVSHVDPTGANSKASLSIANTPRLSNGTNQSKPAEKESGTQIRNASYGVFNSTAVYINQGLQTSVEVLNQVLEIHYPQRANPPSQLFFFKILFRVIISPNAP